MSELAEALRGRVDGDVSEMPDDLQSLSEDFGRITTRTPGVIVRPASTEGVAAVVRLALQHGWSVSTRGAAHSQGGQGLSTGGILLDMTSLAGEIVMDEARQTVTCLAGTTWSDIVGATLRRGLVPPVLTNNLNVTIGGTLSVAGIGVASFKHAAQVDACHVLQVVTGNGDIVECDRERHRDLFDAVRAGLGVCGVITRASIRVRRVKPSVRTFYLLYDDVAHLLRDELRLIERGRVEYLESWCVPCPQGFRQGAHGPEMFAEWFFPLHVTVEFDGTPPDAADVLDGLSPYKRPHVGDQPVEAFARRLDPLFELWRRSGYWASAHPWMETVLPWESAGAFVSQVLGNFPPPALGGGHVLLWPARGRSSDAPLFRTPESDFVVGFGILPGVPPAALPHILPRLTMASDLSTAAGGKRYLSGYLGFDRSRWAAHFGDRWEWLIEMKQRFDPHRVLNPETIAFE